MSLDNLLFVVDGATELSSFKAKFYNKYNCCPELRIGPGNGVDYTEEGYAKGVFETLKFAFNLNTRAAIIIIDREGRQKKSINLSKGIKEHILNLFDKNSDHDKEFIQDKIFVCAPDRMFENWILSDVLSLRHHSEIQDDVDQKNYEGTYGKTKLDELMTCNYKETVHASGLFCLVDHKVGVQNSKTFKRFWDKLEEYSEIYCDDIDLQ